MITADLFSYVFILDTAGQIVGGCFFFFQAEDGIRDLVRSRGLGDVYKRQPSASVPVAKASVFQT